MRLFRRGKDKGNPSNVDTPPADDAVHNAAENGQDLGNDGSGAHAHRQQVSEERAQKPGRGIHAVMNRPTKPLQSQDYIQESIGRFCGLTEDWGIVLELSDNLKTSTANCKLAAEAIRKEFKHGSSIAQERAAKLLVILTRNTSDRFKLQIADTKFLKTYKATLESTKTDPRVKAMIFKALGTIVWENQGDIDLQPLVMLYHDVRPTNAPAEGLPVEDGDKTFEPGPEFGQQAFSSRRSRRPQFDPAAQVEQLKHRATVAKSEASMLNETLAFTTPEEMGNNQIVQEFYRKALAWQQFVSEQLPWVQAEAAKEQPNAKGYEEALDLLLSANGEINDVLKLYHENENRVHRQRREEQELLMATERSKKEGSRLEGPVLGGSSQLRHGESEGMAPDASSSGSSSRASGSGTPLDSGLQPPKVVLQTNNPYVGRSAESTGAVLPDRYIVDEPIDETPPDPVASSRVPIGDKNPFGMYMQQRGESIDAPLPKEPSAKALGKLRRVSGQDADVEEQNRRLEEQLRRKYAENYRAGQHDEHR